jgi:hypothetical protein
MLWGIESIFQLEFELRRRGEALDGRMTEEFVFRLADDEVQRAWLHPVIGACVEQAVCCGKHTPWSDQRASTPSSR